VNNAPGFDGERRQVRVCGQITSSSEGAQEREDQFRMVDQQINVGNNHNATGSQASSLNRRSSIPGRRLPGCGRSSNAGSTGPDSPSPRRSGSVENSFEWPPGLEREIRNAFGKIVVED